MKTSTCRLPRPRAAFFLGLALLAAQVPAAQAGVVLSGGGLALAEQGGTFDANNVAGASFGAVPFASSALGVQYGFPVPLHHVVAINDETFGNGNSWIGDDFDANPFVGVALDGTFTLQSVAFGRDNLNAFADRNLGLYELQYTTVASPDASTPDGDWTTIGTLDYQSAGGANFSVPWLRHRFNFDPVNNVTGVRLLVPGSGISPAGTAIDELELYEFPGVVVPPPPNLVLTPSPGYAIGFNGNNGVHNNPAFPAPVPDNRALASNGAVPSASSSLGAEFGFPFPLHYPETINDGQYGNSNSWIGAGTDPNPSIAVALDGTFAVTHVAWGRDNGNTVTDACGGTCTDRSLGLYTLQHTLVANPSTATPETGDPLTGWATIATIDYLLSDPGVFDPHLRHEFSVLQGGNPVHATGIRLRVPFTGIAGGTAIDEIEVYGALVPEPASVVLALSALAGMLLVARRRR
jgi:hypothetical protein